MPAIRSAGAVSSGRTRARYPFDPALARHDCRNDRKADAMTLDIFSRLRLRLPKVAVLSRPPMQSPFAFRGRLKPDLSITLRAGPCPPRGFEGFRSMSLGRATRTIISTATARCGERGRTESGTGGADSACRVPNGVAHYRAADDADRHPHRLETGFGGGGQNRLISSLPRALSRRGGESKSDPTPIHRPEGIETGDNNESVGSFQWVIR